MTTENTIDTLASELLSLKEQIAKLTKQKKHVEETIEEIAASDINAQLADADYGCGTATLDSDKYKIKYAITKKISWDQELLERLADELAMRGEEPREYVKVKFDVSENAYKNWPSTLQAMFEPARTVSASSPTITIEEK